MKVRQFGSSQSGGGRNVRGVGSAGSTEGQGIDMRMQAGRMECGEGRHRRRCPGKREGRGAIRPSRLSPGCGLLRALLLAGAGLLLAACGDGDREARRERLGPEPTLEARMALADARAGASLFGACSACHTIGRGRPDLAGPNLHGVMDAPIGRRLPRYGSTAALRAVGGTWSDAAMDAWLAAPARFAPGTKMIFPGMPDPLARADLIAYLRSQSP